MAGIGLRSFCIVHPESSQGASRLEIAGSRVTIEAPSLAAGHGGAPRTDGVDFDRVLAPGTPQEAVFEEVAVELLGAFLRLDNAACIALGPSGSGKTFAVTGGAGCFADRGLIPRSISALFEALGKRQDRPELEVSVSFYEVYKGTVVDLLSEQRRRVTLQDGDQGPELVGLLKKTVVTESDAYHVLFAGDSRRHFDQLPANPETSLGHVFFDIHMTHLPTGREAKLAFIDLAASTGAESQADNAVAHDLGALRESLEQMQEGQAPTFEKATLTRLLRPWLWPGSEARKSHVALVSPVRYSAQTHGDVHEWLMFTQLAQKALGGLATEAPAAASARLQQTPPSRPQAASMGSPAAAEWKKPEHPPGGFLAGSPCSSEDQKPLGAAARPGAGAAGRSLSPVPKLPLEKLSAAPAPDIQYINSLAPDSPTTAASQSLGGSVATSTVDGPTETTACRGLQAMPERQKLDRKGSTQVLHHGMQAHPAVVLVHPGAAAAHASGLQPCPQQARHHQRAPWQEQMLQQQLQPPLRHQLRQHTPGSHQQLPPTQPLAASPLQALDRMASSPSRSPMRRSTECANVYAQTHVQAAALGGGPGHDAGAAFAFQQPRGTAAAAARGAPEAASAAPRGAQPPGYANVRPPACAPQPAGSAAPARDSLRPLARQQSSALLPRNLSPCPSQQGLLPPGQPPPPASPSEARAASPLGDERRTYHRQNTYAHLGRASFGTGTLQAPPTSGQAVAAQPLPFAPGVRAAAQAQPPPTAARLHAAAPCPHLGLDGAGHLPQATSPLPGRGRDLSPLNARHAVPPRAGCPDAPCAPASGGPARHLWPQPGNLGDFHAAARDALAVARARQRSLSPMPSACSRGSLDRRTLDRQALMTGALVTSAGDNQSLGRHWAR